MTKKYGVSSTGLIAPIIREGDDIARIVASVVMDSIDNIENGDVIGITESVVARAQGNYVTVDEVAEDIKEKLQNPDVITIINPIFSRNRFAMILKAIARAASRRVSIYFPFVDEVGNVFENHPFTNVNYVEYYRDIIKSEGKTADINYYCSSDPHMGQPTEGFYLIDCSLRPDIKLHDKINKKERKYWILADFCRNKCEWGLLGSNKASEETLKLFPSKKYAQEVVDRVAGLIYGWTCKKVEVMVYGDGCFKDPVGGIWEFADPCVSPAYTDGLEGTPNELKLKNIADEKYANLSGKELEEAIKSDIQNKDNNLKGNMVSQGTTPRRYVDLLASLMDLTSGSGDKGTPIVYVKRYFKNYSED